MMFHTVPFILGFLPVCLAGFFTAGRYCGTTGALRWLVARSLFFYAWWNPRACAAAGRLGRRQLCDRLEAAAYDTAPSLADRRRRDEPGLLGWFKYADFLLHIVAPDAPALDITLPLAISFFTFQQIMFLVDTAARPHRLATSDRRTDRTVAAPYAAFVTFFPHLIAGPIVRPSEIIPQLTAPA